MTIALLLAAAQAASLPPMPELERAIAAADARLFRAAFEDCAPAVLAEVLAPEFAMYHDRGGKVTGSRDAFVARVAEQCAARAPGGANAGYRNRRALVPGSRTIRPMGDWGALEEASHVFYEWDSGGEGESPQWQLVGGARYMHLWQWTAAGPRLLTSYSYDHAGVEE
ncbi:DUF4440 domain-containing protein [Sphingosinicella terrae]|uniref:DUF4440 domain-containing protein n=1 Tax=Sphingosinicella terrae TaxID=2172047 RepID=UPI000E0CECD3|nr:DUF4440 domain-containing protein [Sphingosinicella terrae]